MMIRKDFHVTLREFNPVISSITYIFASINVLLGLCLIFLLDASKVVTQFLLIKGIFSFELWGVIFLILAAVKFYGLITDNWEFTRQALRVGITVKSMWLIMLCFRIFENNQTAIWAIIWLAFIAVEAVVFIYFPRIKNLDKDAVSVH